MAADKLTRLSFSGTSVLPLMGPRNYTTNEVARALGAAIGKPDLRYQQFPAAQAKQGLVGMGMSESMADAFLGLADGINSVNDLRTDSIGVTLVVKT